MTATERTYPWEEPGERVTFATPEQVEVSYRVASFGARIAAALIDQLVVALFSAAVYAGVVLYAAGQQQPLRIGDVAFAAVVATLIVFALQLFYFVWSEMRHGGRTVGKKVLRLRTVMLSGHGLTFGASLIRNLARLIDVVPILWLVPAVMRGQRRLGDLLAGTLVISETEAEGGRVPVEVPLAASYRELAERRFFFGVEVLARLYPDDLNLLEHLFARARDGAGAERRQELQREVALRYAARLDLADQLGLVEADPRRFLEELFLLLRDRYESRSF
jgi:uncharacterized RDD family membrane protein YckC